MEAAAQPEALNQEGLAAFGGRAGDGAPVTMLNLLAFRPEGGRERYEEYGAAVAPRPSSTWSPRPSTGRSNTCAARL